MKFTEGAFFKNSKILLLGNQANTCLLQYFSKLRTLDCRLTEMRKKKEQKTFYGTSFQNYIFHSPLFLTSF